MSKLRIDAERIRYARVLIVGDVMIDHFHYGDVNRISPEAPIPILAVRDQKTMPGGAANVALNVAGLGARTHLIGVVGNDSEGRALGELLGGSAYQVEPVLIADPSRPTTSKARYVSHGQQILRVDREDSQPIGADTEDAVIAATRRLVPSVDVVAVSDYAKGALSKRVLSEIIAMSREAGKPVVVDPKRTAFADYYRGATYIKPNVSELSKATGIDCTTDEGASRAAQAVVAEVGAAVLLTRSEKGMSLYRAGQPPAHVEANVREVFDVSGAGDTALAAFAAALGAGEDAETAMHMANAAASLAVTKRGTAVVSMGELLTAMADGYFFEAMERVAARARAATICGIWKDRGLKVGFTNGCFDILHGGHVTLLAKAAGTCDRLVVALNSDASVRRLKGPSRPVQNEASRLQVIASMKGVDLVTLFDEDTPLELIELLKPDVLIKGADYSEEQVVGGDLVKSYGGRIVLIDLVESMSTTRTIQRAIQLEIEKSTLNGAKA